MPIIVLTPENIENIGTALFDRQNEITTRLSTEMTYLQAEEVRRWRVDFDCTWNRIAELWCERYRGWEADQILGQSLCYRAATILHELPHDEPWN